MDRVTQREEELYQQGRRDGYEGYPDASSNPIYKAGWEAGVLEKMADDQEYDDLCRMNSPRGGY